MSGRHPVIIIAIEGRMIIAKFSNMLPISGKSWYNILILQNKEHALTKNKNAVTFGKRKRISALK